MPVDVPANDDRVVDHDAKHQDETEQRQHVDRLQVEPWVRIGPFEAVDDRHHVAKQQGGWCRAASTGPRPRTRPRGTPARRSAAESRPLGLHRPAKQVVRRAAPRVGHLIERQIVPPQIALGNLDPDSRRAARRCRPAQSRQTAVRSSRTRSVRFVGETGRGEQPHGQTDRFAVLCRRAVTASRRRPACRGRPRTDSAGSSESRNLCAELGQLHPRSRASHRMPEPLSESSDRIT